MRSIFKLALFAPFLAACSTTAPQFETAEVPPSEVDDGEPAPYSPPQMASPSSTAPVEDLALRFMTALSLQNKKELERLSGNAKARSGSTPEKLGLSIGRKLEELLTTDPFTGDQVARASEGPLLGEVKVVSVDGVQRSYGRWINLYVHYPPKVRGTWRLRIAHQSGKIATEGLRVVEVNIPNSR